MAVRHRCGRNFNRALNLHRYLVRQRQLDSWKTDWVQAIRNYTGHWTKTLDGEGNPIRDEVYTAIINGHQVMVRFDFASFFMVGNYRRYSVLVDGILVAETNENRDEGPDNPSTARQLYAKIANPANA